MEMYGSLFLDSLQVVIFGLKRALYRVSFKVEVCLTLITILMLCNSKHTSQILLRLSGEILHFKSTWCVQMHQDSCSVGQKRLFNSSLPC